MYKGRLNNHTGVMMSPQKRTQFGSRCYWNTLGVVQEITVSTKCMINLMLVCFGSSPTK